MFGFIVTTHYNNYKIIKKCLDLLFECIPLNLSYIVLYVNETTCPNVLNIKNYYLKKMPLLNFEVIYINNQSKNGGLTGTWNQGIDYLLNIPFVNCKVITILGHDTFVNKDIKYLLELALEAETNKDLKYFGPLFKNYSGKNDELWQDELHYINYTSNESNESNKSNESNNTIISSTFLIGSIFTFPVHSLIENKLNINMYFNSKNYPFGYNDIDWYNRFLKIGGKPIIVIQCIIDHEYKRTWFK